MAGWFGLPGQLCRCPSVALLFQIIVLKDPSMKVESIWPVGGRLGKLVKKVVVVDILIAGSGGWAGAAANIYWPYQYASHYAIHFPWIN